MPKHANPNGQMHGAELVDWMDTLAATAAKDYAETAVTTASIDQCTFHAPVSVGDTLSWRPGQTTSATRP